MRKPDFKLVVGGIVFQDFEIPSELDFGTTQAHKIHKLVGGGRVIDRLGPDPRPIAWEGRFRGLAAESRARSLERLCNAGSVVSCRWGGYAYSVFVSAFDARYNRFYEIPYHIELTIVGQGGILSALSSLGGLVSADIGAIMSIAGAL